MGSKNHKKKRIEIKCENNIPTTCELIGNRKIIEKKKNVWKYKLSSHIKI